MYELEELLPWAAEEMTADFWIWANRDDTGATALAVTARRDAAEAAVAALDGAGVAVRRVTVDAVLQLSSLLRRIDRGADPASRWWLIDENSMRCTHLWRLERGQPRAWHRVEGAAEHLAARLACLGPPANETPPLAIMEPTRLDALRRVFADKGWAVETMPDARNTDDGNVDAAAIPPDSDDLIAAEGLAALSGASEPITMNLGRDLSNPTGSAAVARSLQWSVAALALLLVFTLAALQAATWRMERITAAQDAAQTAIHVQAVQTRAGGSPVLAARRPTGGIVRRLQAEYDALARQGDGQPNPATSAGPSALAVVADLFARLPTPAAAGSSAPPGGNMNYQIDRVQVGPRGVELVGVVNDHAGAAELARGLSADGRFTAESPQTHATRDGRVGFVLRATVNR